MTVNDITHKLHDIQTDALSNYKAHIKALFGSYARGEQYNDSDVDVLIDLDDGATLFDLGGLKVFLEEQLGLEVDVVPMNSLKEGLREPILREAIWL